MKSRKLNSNSLLFISILFYSIYIIFKLRHHKVLLADDLSQAYIAQNIGVSFWDFLTSYLDSQTMSARPVSGLITGTIVFLSKYDISIYYIGLIFFPISLYLLYKVLNYFFENVFSVLIVALYASSIFASSIQFSIIMLNSNLATIFWLLSIYFLTKKYNIFLSITFFIFSILSYEIFLPLIILNILLVKNKINTRVFYFLSIILIIVSYKKILQPILFENSYQRDNVSQIFNWIHVQKVILFSIKMFLRDYFYAAIKSIYNIRLLNITELLIPLFIGALNYPLIDKKCVLKEEKITLKKVLIVSIVAIILSLGVFVFSTYTPSFYGFNNRNLGAIRVFSSLLSLSLIFTILKYLNVKASTLKIVTTALIIFSFYINLSICNSWIYASDFNHKLFSQLSKELNHKKIMPKEICIDYNVYDFQKSNNFLILREPTFFETWEYPYLAILNGLNPSKVKILNKERKRNQPCQYEFKFK